MKEESAISLPNYATTRAFRLDAEEKRPANPKVVACIPAYNEEKCIAAVILRAQRFVDEVIVCDDGSTDMTGEIAESVGATVIYHRKNMGKGATLRSLFDLSIKKGASIVVTIDGDGQHDPKDIPKVIRPLVDGDADVSIGGRFNGINSIPFHRRVGNSVLTVLTNLGNGHGPKIVDTQSGFRAYTLQAVKEIEVRDDGMGADSQILMDARRKKFRITESHVGVSYGEGTSTHNAVRHFGDVAASIVRYASEEHPLVVLGVPGIVLLAIGLVYGGLLLSIYANTRDFIFAYALFSVGAVLAGLFLVLVAVVLFSLSNLVRRTTQSRTVRT